jgi:Ser/Thr protein kinase RdoA (MazF antagonist)
VEVTEASRAVAAAVSAASSLDLSVDGAIVLQDANRLVVRLAPCDVVARISRMSDERYANAAFEIELAQQLAGSESPVATVEPRVEPRPYLRDGFVMSLWTYYETAPARDVAPTDYARALEQLHAGLRQIDLAAPHYSDRVADALRVVADRELSPELAESDRQLLSSTLRRLSIAICGRTRDEQLLHGEPHPGNLLNTRDGALFVDLETCCRGPVEFDLAHAPDEVAGHYPLASQDLISQCRILTLAMITTWRWQRDDQYPQGRYWALEGLKRIRAAIDNPHRG